MIKPASYSRDLRRRRKVPRELSAAFLSRRSKVCQEAAETKARRRIYRLRILIGRSAVRRYTLYRVCRANSGNSPSFRKNYMPTCSIATTTNGNFALIPCDHIRLTIHSSFYLYSSLTITRNESNYHVNKDNFEVRLSGRIRKVPYFRYIYRTLQN